MDEFINSLDGIVKIARDPPTEIATRKPEVVTVPDRVTEDYICNTLNQYSEQRVI